MEDSELEKIKKKQLEELLQQKNQKMNCFWWISGQNGVDHANQCIQYFQEWQKNTNQLDLQECSVNSYVHHVQKWRSCKYHGWCSGGTRNSYDLQKIYRDSVTINRICFSLNRNNLI